MAKISGGIILERGLENSTVNRNAGALIFSSSTKRFLFLLRNADKKHKSTWGLVGGRMEDGERPAQALLREAREEVSIDFSNRKILPIETFTSDDQNFIYYTFLIVVQQEFVPMLNLEHRGYAWVNLRDYPTPLHPGVWKTFRFEEVLSKIAVVIDIL